MTIKTNMTTEQKFERFQNMIEDKLEVLKDYKINEVPDELDYMIVELNTTIYTTKELTEITEHTINEYIYQETGYTIDNLIDIENSFY